MPYSLVYLEKASGYAGSAGQSFRNNVLNAGDGVKMTDYFCNGWSFSGEPAPDLTYNDNATFNLSIAFSQGIRGEWIKRVGSGLILISPGLSPYGFDVSAKSSNVVGPASGSSASFTVRAPIAGTVSYSGTAWFTGYISPDKPATSGPEDVTFSGVVTASASGGTDSVSVTMQYVPDNGPFNPTLTATFPFTMNRRAPDTNASNYEWQWYTDSSYSTLYHTGPSFTVQTYPQESRTYYLKARKDSGSVWTEVGPVDFTDRRNVV